jgi:anti-sigma factor RsiW
MNCDIKPELLDAYADDSCSPEELTQVESHLRDCPSCVREVLGRIQGKRMNRAAAARFTPSPEFRLRIEKSIRPKPGLTSLLPMPFLISRLSVVAAALVVVAIAVSISVTLWTRHSAREQALSELLDLHVATLASANPVDVISTDRHTVKPWFQGKLPFTFNLPELQNTPFRLIGAKLMYFRHSPGAQLLFETGKHSISVFIVQDQAGMITPGTAVGSNREKGFSVESWSAAGLRYVAISDTGPRDIHALSELLRSAAGQ